MSKPAKKIYEYLRENGIKQKYIAEKTGIKNTILSSRLNGASRLRADEIELICGVLGKEPNDFLTPRGQ